MAKVVYSAIASLDGYIEDDEGSFDWAAPSDEVHTFVNDLERSIGTYLYGRRMYETMVFWETVDTNDQPAAVRAITRKSGGRSKNRVLPHPSGAIQRPYSYRTQLRPVGDQTTQSNLGRRHQRGRRRPRRPGNGMGLIDECRLFLCPVIVGGGKRALPNDFRAQLELLAERRFENGVVYLHYRLLV